MYNMILPFLILGLAVASGDRVPPGMPPQHYQQPPQQYQQQQQYQQHPQPNVPPSQQYQQQVHQQQQMQYQQVPVQQQPPVHQQVPVQQVAPGHGGGHHAPHGHQGQQQVLNTANIQHEREHIQEHMQVPIDTSKMSEAELQFHYFKMHDSDNNNKLDGCELIKSLIHWHEQGGEDKENIEKNKGEVYTDEKISEIVEQVLSLMDLNNDGYIDYSEYRKSQEGSDNKNKG